LQADSVGFSGFWAWLIGAVKILLSFVHPTVLRSELHLFQQTDMLESASGHGDDVRVLAGMIEPSSLLHPIRSAAELVAAWMACIEIMSTPDHHGELLPAVP
jgi:hypothetical protein